MTALVSEILPMTMNFLLQESLERKKMKPRKTSFHSDRLKTDYEGCYMPWKGVWLLLTQNGKQQNYNQPCLLGR